MVRRLAATPEGDGTLVDHTLLLYGIGMSDRNTHFHDDLPIAPVGARRTGIRGGRYLRYGNQPLTNLHVRILERLGFPVDTLADTSGRLEGLTVV